MSLTVKQLTSMGCKQLEEAGILDAKRDSESLYCHMVGIPASKMIAEYQYKVQDLLCDRYFELIDRRASGEPLQYIVGTTSFMGFPFKTKPGVLIPRLDTEVLVDDALHIINGGSLRGEIYGLDKKAWDVLDLCTGTGAIGISIAKMGKKCNVTLSDISPEAIDVAKKNARLNGVEKKVKIVEGDMFTPFDGRFGSKKFDMIISNPPYIPTDIIGTLQREIKEHEPMLALDGGEDGMDYYRVIAKSADKYLKKNGILMLEIGSDQLGWVTDLLRSTGVFSDVRGYKDLVGNDRVVFAIKRG